MLILIIGLIILAGIAMAVGVLHNRQIQKKIESGEMCIRDRDTDVPYLHTAYLSYIFVLHILHFHC